MARVVGAWIFSVLITYTLASAAVSIVNACAIQGLGYPLSTGQWSGAIASDWLSMLQSYLLLIAVGLAIAFVVVSMISRFTSVNGAFYAIAGFVAILTIHLLMKQLLGMSPVAPARFWYGLMSQGLAGAFGGYFYFRLKAS